MESFLQYNVKHQCYKTSHSTIVVKRESKHVLDNLRNLFIEKTLADVTFKFKEHERTSIPRIRPNQSSHIARRIRKPRPCTMF
jgi:hypothetical protein